MQAIKRRLAVVLAMLALGGAGANAAPHPLTNND
eukprot:SAG31_NODE_13698_length_852_cov_1.567065_1_plen_33_part_10